MKTLKETIDVLLNNPDKDENIIHYIQEIGNTLYVGDLTLHHFNKVGKLTVELRDLLKSKYPNWLMDKINNIIKNDLSRGEVSEKNYIDFFFYVNKVWKTWGQDKF